MKETRVAKNFREYRSEYKKIVWPSRVQTAKNSSVVLIAIIAFTIVIGVLDFGLEQLVSLLAELVA